MERRFWTSLTIASAVAGLALALTAYRSGTPAVAATVPGISIPPGYRDWRLISVAILGSPFNDIRAVLGNDVAIAALRARKISLPDGAIIARLAWKQVRDPKTNDALSHEPLNSDSIRKLLSGTFVAGSPTNLQFMVKDSTKYASTGGWGFAQFTNGKSDTIVQRSCFACHVLASDRGFVFTPYSP